MNQSSFNLLPVLADGERQRVIMFNWNRSAWAPVGGLTPREQGMGHSTRCRGGGPAGSHSVGGGAGGYPAEQWGAVCRDAQVVAAKDERESGPGHASQSGATWHGLSERQRGKETSWESEWLGGYLGLRQESLSCSFYLHTHVIKTTGLGMTKPTLN